MSNIFYTIKATKILQSKIFTKWFNKLDFTIQQVLLRYVERLRNDNFSNTKSVGNGIFELKVNYQKGYRLYFTEINKTIIFLLCDGDKSTQQKDIEKAQEIKDSILK